MSLVNMKQIYNRLFFLFFWTCISLWSEPADEKAPLRLTLSYAFMFDNICSTQTNYKIDPAWVRELDQLLPQWQKLWLQQGNALLAQTLLLLPLSLQPHEVVVPGSLCNFPSISMPLIVNVRSALKSYTKNPVIDAVVINIIFHELLHNFIGKYWRANLPLLKKYRKESKMVLYHLHLCAITKAVYLRLGLKTELKAVIKADQALASPAYRRAWEIIDKQENYMDFVNELAKAAALQPLLLPPQ